MCFYTGIVYNERARRKAYYVFCIYTEINYFIAFFQYYKVIETFMANGNLFFKTIDFLEIRDASAVLFINIPHSWRKSKREAIFSFLRFKMSFRLIFVDLY